MLVAQHAAKFSDVVTISLDAARDLLGMEIAYLSEFVDGRLFFRAVSATGSETVVRPGVSMDIKDVYCQHILNGSLPKLMIDTFDHALAKTMPITYSIPIRSYVSVPVYRGDGSVYGMFCCLSRQPNPTLTSRDVKVMESFANISSKYVNETPCGCAVQMGASTRLMDIIEKDQVAIVLQPIFDLATEKLTGFEALSRFTGLPYRRPDLWFQEARTVGFQLKLESFAIRKAVDMLSVVPDELTISINVSPETIVSGEFRHFEASVDFNRLVIEITEHTIVHDYTVLLKETSRLQALGAKIAVDDVGAGYSGLINLLRMRPDMLKLDIELVRNIDTDEAKQSLVVGMVNFANSIGAVVIAEGIETEMERATLRSFGVERGQGYLLGKPVGLSEAQRWIST